VRIILEIVGRVENNRIISRVSELVLKEGGEDQNIKVRQLALLAPNVVLLDRDWQGTRKCEVLFCLKKWVHKNEVKENLRNKRCELGRLQSTNTPENGLNVVETVYKFAKTCLKPTGTEKWFRVAIILSTIDFKIMARGW